MTKPIRLTVAQQLDVDLALATECLDGLDPDCAAYLSYQLSNGPIPARKLVARTCDNPACCNPEHLVLVSE
jgi:hypothetical protein